MKVLNANSNSSKLMQKCTKIPWVVSFFFGCNRVIQSVFVDFLFEIDT